MTVRACLVTVTALALAAVPVAAAENPTEPAPAAGDGAVAPKFEEKVEVVAPPILDQDRVSPLTGLVTEVSSRQISDLAAHDLAAALRRVPGVSIARYNAVGSYGGADGGAIYLRGHGSGRPGAEIGTLTDGIPRFVGVWTHPVLDTLDVEAADRIEVWRGAQPVLLGTMSFGAVNVVPHRIGTPGFETRLALEAGSFATSAARVEHGGRSGRWDYLVSAGRRSSDGHREHSAGAVEAAHGRVGVAIADGWEASLLVDWSDSWAEDPGREGAAALAVTPRFGVRDTFAVATLAHEHGRSRGTLKLYADDGAIRWRQWDAATSSAFDTDTDWRNSGVRWREQVQLADGFELLFGLDHDVYGGESRERRPSGDRPLTEIDFRNDAPYAALSVRLRRDPEITASVGARYNQSRYFGDDWGAQGGVTARLGAAQLYLTAARGFNLPGVWAVASYAGWGRGDQWQELEPEQVDHMELGAIAPLAPWARVTVSVYHDQVDDALRFVPPPPPPPLFANVGSYRVRGGELSVTIEPSPQLAGFAGIAYAESDPDDVPNAPVWTLVGGVAWAPHPRLRLSLDAQWVDDQVVYNPRYASTGDTVGASTLLNATSSWRLGRVAGALVRFNAAVGNLADADSEVRPGYPMPGRSLNVGVEAEL